MKQLKNNLKNHFIFDSKLLCIGIITLCLFSCAEQPTPQASLEERSLIPTSASLQSLEGTFQITTDTQFYIQDTLQQASTEFMDRLVTATGFNLKINALPSTLPTEGFVIMLSDQVEQEEGYALKVTPDVLVLEASTEAGIYRGLQTVIQLLPAEIVANQESPIN